MITGVESVAAPDPVVGGALEQVVKPRLPWFDIAVWRERMAAVERRVCRVELFGNAAGTGFLVGPDAVLTNHHVLGSVLRGEVLPDVVTCRFDYRILTDGSTPDGVVVGLHPTGWHIDNSPPSLAESGDSPDPASPAATADQLDYALIRLARRVGDEPLAARGTGAALRRGWILVPTLPSAFIAKMPLMIAQYPVGQPLKLAVDTEAVIGTLADGNRVRYATNTEHGSSGSPVFDLDWKLVALHHLGGPTVASSPSRYNQGIPVARIRERLGRSGKAAVLDEAVPTDPLPTPAPLDAGAAQERAAAFRAAFEKRRLWFDRLNAYKRLHEVLHKLLMMQIGIDEAARQFRDKSGRSILLVQMADTLEDDLLAEANAANAGTEFPQEAQSWIDSFAAAVTGLRSVRSPADLEALGRAVETLRALPNQRQAALDREVVRCVLRLGTEELATILDDVLSAPNPPAAVAALRRGLSDFRDLCRPLGGLTTDHGLCQEVETALASVNADDAVKDQVPRWPDVLAALLRVAGRRSKDRLAARTVVYAVAFDGSPGGEAATESFLLLRNQFALLFSKLDKELLDVTDGLVHQAAVLSARL